MAFPPPPHTFMFHHEDPNPLKQPFPPLPPQHFQTPPPRFMMKRSMSFCSGMENHHHHDHHEEELMMMGGGGGDDEVSDDGSGVQIGGEKKKRLNVEQVKALEKSFEVGNKLEPERKMELAKALGLQPRQIAIWFQNRRARWKTKNLEKEYQILKKQFDSLKQDNDALKLHNQNLHAQLEAMKGRENCEGGGTVSVRQMMMKKETEGSWSNGSDNSSDMINLDLSRTPPPPLNINMTTTTTHHHQNGNNLKPTTTITQLLHFSSRSDLQDVTFSNMFHHNNNINDDDHHDHDHEEDQQHNFWTWPPPEHHHFH